MEKDKLFPHTIVTDSGLPSSQSHNFQDYKEEAVVVLECADNKYFVFHSTFVAKQLRQIIFGLYTNDWFKKYKPIRVAKIFLTKPNDNISYGGRDSSTVSHNLLTKIVFYAYVQQYGIANVRTSIFPINVTERGFEKTLEEVERFTFERGYNYILNPNTEQNKVDNINNLLGGEDV